MTTNINADTVTGGAIITGDASGELALQAAGVTKLTVSSAGVTIPTLIGANVNLTSNVSGTLPVLNGGTGATTLATNNVLLGNGASAVQTIAPGASGNVLTSNGTTWASSTPATGYPTTSFVASGALSNGNVVVLNTNGTVSIVSGAAPSVGTPVSYVYGMSANNDACYDPTTGKVVVVFRSNNYSYGTLTGSYLVGTVSGTTITWGAQGNYSGGIVTDDTVSCCSIGNGKIAVTYDLNSSNATGYVMIGTISGTSISFGTPLSLGAYTQGMRVRFDSGNNKVAVLKANVSAQTVTLFTYTYSGTTLTQTGSVVIVSGTTAPATISPMLNMSYDSSAARLILMYCDRSNNGYGTAQVANLVTATPTVGAKSVFNAAATNYISGCYDPINNKTVICYQNSTTYGTAIVGTVTSTTISFGGAQTFNSAATNYIGAVYCSFQKRIAIIWQGFSLSASLSGTTLSFQTPVANTGASCYGAVAYDSTNYKVVYAYYQTSQVFEPGYTTVTNWVGVATNSAANGAAVNVAMQGAVATNQTGLTTGTTYYLDSAGALTTSSSATGYKIGKALSATSLLITEGNAA